ncbi:MAG: OPT/YSL family transporter, partial [Myxococcaceae bacterium]
MSNPASPLPKKCPDCGTENGPGAEYCSKCAHPLIAVHGETPDSNLRGDIFGQEGAWLDKSNKETAARKKEAPKPLDQQGDDGEVELAFDPLQRRTELDAAAAKERESWEEAKRIAASKPRYELTARSIIVGIVVALFVGASYPYVVLKLGYGPNISVVSAFFGYMILAIVGVVMTKLTKKDWRSGRVEYNIVQTAGSAAGQTAFMCVLLAAFDLLAANKALAFSEQPVAHLSDSPFRVFMWLSVAGLLGVLLAVPMRRYYIDQEK